MAGSRHSQADQAAIQAAHDALVEAGARCAAMVADGKSSALATLKAIRPQLKAMMDADPYADLYAAASEAMDVARAADVLEGVMCLIQGEAWDADADTAGILRQLVAIARGLMSFISGELDEIGSLAQAADPQATAAPAPAPATLSVKALGGAVKRVDDTTLKGIGVYYGGKDLYDDTFTPTTDFGEGRSFIGMPVYYDHTLSSVKSQVGTVKAWEATDDGLLFEIELDKHKTYVADILRLADKGALGFSTGALAHTVVRDAGELKRWIIGEISLTPSPAEPRTLGVQPVKAAPTGTPEATAEARRRAGAAQTVPTIRII